jgi:aminoglycoside/choline kinase family phosphotransferase
MHEELKGWLDFLGFDEPVELTQLHGDENSRRYYRIENIDKNFVVVDASSDKETVPEFIGIGMRLKRSKMRTPLVRSFELHKGFMLLEDVGSTHLYDKCVDAGAGAYYEKAIRTLVQMQTSPTINMKPYDAMLMLEEMNLMLEWYYNAHLGKTLECVEGQQLIKMFSLIAKEVLAQPQETFVHTDSHSKNLMIDEKNDMVVMDFQDAREGALTYDLVSLLYDPYVSLDKRERQRFIKLFKNLKGIEVEDEVFMRWVDFTALQRNLTLLGKFTRLSIEEKKETYLEHTPLIRQYILDIASKYPELEQLLVMLTPQEEDSLGFL